MELFSINSYVRRAMFSVSLAVLLFASSISTLAQSAPATAAIAPRRVTTLTAGERKAANQVKLETIKEVTAKLSSNEFEGRGTGQPGADKAANYLAEQFAKMGLKPAGDNGTFLQAVKFKVAEILPESSFKAGDVSLKHGTDYVVLPPYSSPQVDVTSEIVFAGYGVVSTELKRNDLEGLDLKDKIVVIMGGQPDGVDEKLWQRATSPQVRGMTIFSRGAAAMVVANAGTPQQPYSTIANYLSRRRVSSGSTPFPSLKLPAVLIVSDEAMEKIFAGSELTFAQTLAKAKSGVNVSRNLGKTGTLALRFRLAETTSSNVVAKLEGSDPVLKEEAVVYTAHYDAYGIENGVIYPGAADNALGTATITAIAAALAKTTPRPRRSFLFLAVTGEEYGLLGAEYWVQNPTWPLDKIAADINFDGIGTEIYGPVKRVVGFGANHSTLGPIFEDVTVATGTIATPDPMPEENAFVRSDHYAFVKKGVPALMLMGGPAGDVSQWIPRARKWLDTDYHSASDTIKPDWNWTGPQTLGQVGLLIGLRVANADERPTWNASSPFNRTRNLAKPAAGN